MRQEVFSAVVVDQLVQRYAKAAGLPGADHMVSGPRDRAIANLAAGLELDQCCDDLKNIGRKDLAIRLRQLRRPKSPVELLKDAELMIHDCRLPTSGQCRAIRDALRAGIQALEASDND